MTLKFAKLHEQELTELAATILPQEEYKYYNAGYLSLPELEKDEWNHIDFVSYTDKVIGYFSASIVRVHNVVTSLSVFSAASTYKEYKVFERDLLDFFLYLLKRFNTVEFSCIVDNPVRKKYIKFVQVVGGNIIGIQHSRYNIMLNRMDCELYEVVSTPEVIEKIRELRDRIVVPCSYSSIML